MRIARALAAVLSLAGCAPAPAAPLWLAERGVVYCYRTIADPDCYRQPLFGGERRLIAAAPQIFFTPVPAGQARE